jgi:hypothetical protein
MMIMMLLVDVVQVDWLKHAVLANIVSFLTSTAVNRTAGLQVGHACWEERLTVALESVLVRKLTVEKKIHRITSLCLPLTILSV